MATLKSVCGPQVRTAILVGFVEEQGGVAEIPRTTQCISTLRAQKNQNSRGGAWQEVRSLPCSEVVLSGPLKSSDCC